MASSGGSRGPRPPLILGKKEIQEDMQKSLQGKQNIPFSPVYIYQGLVPPHYNAPCHAWLHQRVLFIDWLCVNDHSSLAIANKSSVGPSHFFTFCSLFNIDF